MAITTYNQLGSKVTINVSGTTVTAGFDSDVALVGGYDSANAAGSTTAGETTKIQDVTDAETAFGSSCELTRQVKILGGADTIYGAPVPETQTTESFSNSSSGTLNNVPFFDPNVHPDHTIDAQDTTNNNDVDVNIVYVDGSPATPSSSDTINLDHVTGQWTADTSEDYDITYTYGDWQPAIDAAVQEDVRYIGVCTEDDGVESYTVTQLENEADNGNYMRAVVGADVGIASGSISSYTPSTEDWRMIEVAPARGTMVDGKVRTLGAVISELAIQPITAGGSVTYDTVSGLESLRTNYTPNEASNFDQVLALTRDGEIAEGVTTAADANIRDIYVAEIVDAVIESMFETIDTFSGGPNTQNDQKKLRAALRRVARSYASTRPPALATGTGDRPYDITVSLGANDDEVDVTAGIEPASIMKQINLNLNVGEVRSVNVSA